MVQSISLPRRGFALPSVRDSLSDFTVRTEIGGVELIDRLAGEWRALAAGDPRTLPMMMPEWIATHLRRHEPGAQLVIVTARRDGRLSALLPLVSESIRYHGVPLTRWRFANDYRYPAPTDLLHAEQDRDRAVQAIWRHLAADTRWDLLELADVAEGTALSSLLNLANAMGYPTERRRNRLTPILALPGPGTTFETAAGHVNAKFRATVRRRKRRLEETGPVQFRRIEAADPAELERFFALEASGWKGRNGTAILSDPTEHAYYAELARETAARGYFTLYVLECAGEPVAMQYGVTINGRYHLPKVAFDETKGEFSPGHILMQEIVRDCAEQGLTEIDFLGNADDWKARWANTERAYDRLSIFRPSIAGRLGHTMRFRLMPTAKRLRTTLNAYRAHAGNPSPAGQAPQPGNAHGS